MPDEDEHLKESVTSYMRTDFTTLDRDLTVEEALKVIREVGLGEKIIYFYVIDEDERLVGVLPTRRLLTAPPEQKLSSIMISRVISLPDDSTLLEACELFVMHKFLAVPVVDGNRHLVGVVDVNVLTEEVFDLAERERMDELFESIGFRVTQVREASPAKAFRFRFPWLLATITSGTICALLAGFFEATLQGAIVLAFFITLVLALGESVTVQSMTVSIQALRGVRPTLKWYLHSFRREILTALLLGTACGLLVAAIVWLWRGEGLAAWVVGGSIFASLCAACLIGLSVPTLLHALKLDPKIAAGPVSLAMIDIFTLLFYLSLGSWIL